MKSNHDYIAEYNRLMQECNAVYHAAAMREGLSDSSFQILYMLRDAGDPCKQGDISDRASLPPQTVNSALKKLEKEGLVVLKRIDGKPGKSIHLTAAGQRLVREKIDPVIRAEEAACEAFSEEEKAAFFRLLDRLVKQLQTEINGDVKDGE